MLTESRLKYNATYAGVNITYVPSYNVTKGLKNKFRDTPSVFGNEDEEAQ